MAYTQAEIDAVVAALNAGTVTTAELEAIYGVPASEIQANLEAVNTSTGYVAPEPVYVAPEPVYDPATLDIFQDTTGTPSYMDELIQGAINYDYGPINVTDSSIDDGPALPADDIYTPPEIDDDEGVGEETALKETFLGDAFDAIANSGLTAGEMTAQVAELLRTTNMSSDALAQVSDFTKEELDTQLALLGYDTRGNTAEPTEPTEPIEPTEPTEPPPAEEPDGNIINQVGTQVGEAIDSIFQTLGLPNPSKIIGAPNTSTGTVVWGPSGGSPIINTGTTGAGTQTGVTTGNAALDAVLNKVTGILTGRIEAGDTINAATAKDILVATAAQETGISPEAIGKLIEAGGDITKLANLSEDDATKIGVDLSNEDVTDGGIVRDDGSTAYPDGTVIRADGTVENPFDSTEPQPTVPVPTDGGDPFVDGEPSPDDTPPPVITTPPAVEPPPAIGGGGGGLGDQNITAGMFGDFVVNQRVAPETKLLTRLFRNV